MPKYYYSSVAAPAKLQGTITDTQTKSIILDTTTGLPASFPFKLVIDPSGSLEAIKVNAMSGTTITDCVRGVDGTTASAHDVGVDVIHDSTAEDFGDPNDHVYGSQVSGSARHPATAISVSATGGITSPDVQGALAGLDTKSTRQTRTFYIGQQPNTSATDGDNGFFTVSIPAGGLTLVGADPVGIAGTGLTWKLRRYTGGAWADIAGFGTTAVPLSGSTAVSGQSVTLADGDRLGLFVVAAGSGYKAFAVTVLLDRTA